VLAKDGELLERHRIAEERAKNAAFSKKLLVEKLKQGEFLQGQSFVFDEKRQAGKPLFPHELKTLIQRMMSDPSRLIVQDHPWLRDQDNKPLTGMFYFRRPNGELLPLSPYHNRLLPEYSVMEPVYEWVPDPNLPTKRVEGREIQVMSPEVLKSERPGFVKRLVSMKEVMRGWRTIVVRAALADVIPVEKALRLFASESQGWNRYLKGNAPSAIQVN
jgi:hypothetical protein